MKRRASLLFLLPLLATLACSLLNPPQGLTVPTPPSTGGQTIVQFQSTPLVNPEAATIPLIDPFVEELIGEVSRQNLSSYVVTLSDFGTRNTLSDPQGGDFGIGAARRWLHDEFVRVGGGRLQVSYDDFRLNYAGLTSEQRNVVAVLPGAGPHPGRILVVAHYDSRSVNPNDGRTLAPGANDNGSGVAVLLELARLMSPYQWNQTIMFVAYAAEEQGTHGSKHFVQQAWLEGMQFDAVLNNDIVGGRPAIPQSVRVFGAPEDRSKSRQLARYMLHVGNLYMPDFGVEPQLTLDRPDRFSDHREFVNLGVAAVRISESEEDMTVQHTSQDTADRLDYDYLAQVVRLNLAVVSNLAGGPAPPEAPIVAKMANPGGYIITWNVEPGVAAYAISFRPVGAPAYGELRYVSREDAGNVALTGIDASQSYAVSLAGIDVRGRLGLFSPEVIVDP